MRTSEGSRPRIRFEKAVDRLCLKPHTLGQALGGTARGRTEPDRDSLRSEDLQDRVDQRCLADARPTSDHQHLRGERNADGLPLALSERQLRPLLDPGDRLVSVYRRPGRLPKRQRLELRRDLLFGPIQPREEHATSSIEIVCDDCPSLDFEAKRGLDKFGRSLQELLREWEQLLGGETAMPFVHRLGERVGDAGTHAN